MSFHWPSFLLGALCAPLIALLGAFCIRWLGGWFGRVDVRRLAGPRAASGTLEPLHFTPRLIGQIRRRPPEAKEPAQAS